jgi:iron complex outermembrane recepter protein
VKSIRVLSAPTVIGPIIKVALVSLQVACAIMVRPSIADTTAPGSDDQLQEIVITAQRREETINSVPISVTAFSQQTMDDLRIQTVADLASIVPGLYLQPTGAAGQDDAHLAIRGIDTSGNAPTTQFYIDETPIAIRTMPQAGNSYSPQPLIFDLDRVEVLRGPQGTLFGASAMGGAIRFITPQPNLDSSSGLAKVDLGYTEQGSPNYEVGAAYGAPIIPGELGYRVSAWYQRLGGFIDQEDPYTGELIARNINRSGSYVIRPAVAWSPTDGLTVTTSAFIQHKESDNPDQYWLTLVPQPETNGNKVWSGQDQPLTDDLRVGSLSVKYNFSGLTLQSNTSYVNRQERAIDDVTAELECALTVNSTGCEDVIPGLNSFHSFAYDRSSTNSIMQEVRLSSQSPSGRLFWTVGAFYNRSSTSLVQEITPDLTPLTLAAGDGTSMNAFGIPDFVYEGATLNAMQRFSATDISTAGFADLGVNIISNLRLELGARVDHVVVEHQNQFLAGPLNDVPSPTYQTLPDQVGNPVTPRASLSYQYLPDNMVYASASKGYRPGGGNSQNADLEIAQCQQELHLLGLESIPKSFGSDSLWTYELGSKNSLFDHRLLMQASVYYTQWKQVQTGEPACGLTITLNRGEAIVQGADFQAQLAPLKGLRFGILAGYTDAYYPNATYAPQAPNSSTPPVLLAGAGDKLAGIPWSGAINGEYSHDTSGWWDRSQSYLRLDWRYLGTSPRQDDRVNNFAPWTYQSLQRAYSTLNLRAGVVHDGLDVSLYVLNATNADPLLGWTNFSSFGEDPHIEADALRPRTFGITAWYRFKSL